MAGERRVGALLTFGTERLRASGSASPRLDAELLLGQILGTDRAGVLAHPEVEVGPEHAARYMESVLRREKGEPIAYIRGIKEFYGFVFVVDERALIPRPETELLVELGLTRVRDLLISAPRPAGTPPLLVADVGTGSGAVAISLALLARRRGYDREVRFIASDVNLGALSLARENGVGHGVADIVDFVEADLMPVADRPFDLVLANLPYIPSADIPALAVAASFEPALALDGGANGLALIGRLLGQLPSSLSERGRALLEIGADQADAVRGLGDENLAGWSVTIHNDLGGRPRIAEFNRLNSGIIP